MNTNSLLKISWCLLLVEIIIAQAPTFKMKLEKVEKSLLVDMNLNLLEETQDLSSKWGYNTYMNNIYMINNLPIPGINNPTPNKNFGQYLYNYKEVQFIGQIALGSKKKVFKVIFDSGSSALWVSTPADIYAKGKHHHTCEKQTSTTCKKGDFKSKYIGYGSGKIWGNIVSDDMWIPNVRKKSDKKKKFPETDKQLIEKIEMYSNQKPLLEKPQISDEGKHQIKGEYLSFEKNDWGHVKNQHIILVKNSPGMERNKSDGVLGIGPQDREDLESIFTNLKKQSVVDKEIFSIYQSLDEDKKPSELEIGGYDEDLVEKSGNEIVWSHIVDPKKWKVALDDVKIDGESVYAQSSLVGKFLSYFNTVMMPMYSKSFDSNKKEALIDSGTSWMVVTASDGKKYIKACKKRGIDCELKEGLLYCDRDKKSKWDAKYLPKLEYVIRGHKYAIKKELLIVECQPNDTGDGDSCLLRIRPMNWKHRILGMPFMMTNYCIFDRESKMVGIQDLGLDKAKVTDSISEKNDSSYAFMRRKVDFQRNYFKNVTMTFASLILIVSAVMMSGYVLMHCQFGRDDDINADDDNEQRIQERTRLVQQRPTVDQQPIIENVTRNNAEEIHVLEEEHREPTLDGIELESHDSFNAYNGNNVDDSVMAMHDGKLVEKYTDIGGGICVENIVENKKRERDF